jgi:hypothetical protein
MKNVLKILSAGERSVEKRLGLKVWTEEEEARNMREQLEKHIPSKEGPHRGWAKYIPIWFCLIFGLVLGWYARSRRYPIEEHQDVQILQQVSPSEWMLQGRDLPYMRWKCCPDFNCASVIQAGYIAAIVRYEDRGVCKSIYSTGLGFFYHHAGEVWWTKLNHEKEY